MTLQDMVRLITLLTLLPLILFSGCDRQEELTYFERDKSLLVFSKTTGFRHSSIEAGVEAVRQLGRENRVDVVATEDPVWFQSDSLAGFDAVLFLNTTGTVLNEEQKRAFEMFIRGGGGFAGVHSAADTEYEWPWYGELVGAWFASHPRVQYADLRVIDDEHLATSMLPDPWHREDEWYNFGEVPGHVNVLLELDTESFEGSEHPGSHPISWYHEFDGGRAFYTGLGHTNDSWSEALFLRHLWGGLEYVMGRTADDVAPQSY